ncbi:MAG: sensor histidine kinase [Thermoanaerobaculia bacterium]
MKRARFRRTLVWALAGPVTLLAVLAVTFLLLIRWLNVEADSVEHADRVLSKAQRTQALIIDMETGVRGYLLTHEDAFLTPYRSAMRQVGPAFDEMQSLVRDNPVQSERVNALRAAFSSWQNLATRMLAPESDNEIREKAQIAARHQMDGIRRLFADLTGTEEQLRAKRTENVRRVTRTLIAISMSAALFLGLVVGVMTRRALRRVAGEYEEALAESEAARAQSEGLAVENERLFHEADSASRTKDEFLATLSHELRTPLTAILGWARLLQIQEFDADSSKSGAAAIERSAKAQAALIEDILDVSRIITGKLTLDIKEVQMGDAVRAAVESIQPAANAKGIQILVDAPADIVVSADPNRLQQILWNLLSNAVKFSGRGTQIRVAVVAGQDDVTLTVADQGMGIDPGFLPYVFDRFRQADSTSTREHGGLGIGLSVVKLLVELHGGTVRAASAGPGKGTTFTVTIPVRGDAANLAARPAAPESRDYV